MLSVSHLQQPCCEVIQATYREAYMVSTQVLLVAMYVSLEEYILPQVSLQLPQVQANSLPETS